MNYFIDDISKEYDQGLMFVNKGISAKKEDMIYEQYF